MTSPPRPHGPDYLRFEQTEAASMTMMLTSMSGHQVYHAFTPKCALCKVGPATVRCPSAKCGNLCDVCERTEYDHSKCPRDAVRRLVHGRPLSAEDDPQLKNRRALAVACDQCMCRPVGLPYFRCLDCDKVMCNACEKINDGIFEHGDGDLVPFHAANHVMAKHRVYETLKQ